MIDAEELGSVLLYGFGITNVAVAKMLTQRGVDVVVVDDRPTAGAEAAAGELGLAIVVPDAEAADWLDGVLGGVDALIASPGLPESHAVFTAAERLGVRLLSEFDLAARWDDRPLLSITGTNGKTTVTTLVTEMLNRSGLRAAAVGNTDVPLVAALDDATIDVFVVEASSFRLAATEWFRPRAATWLNFAEDHLDVHASLDVYEAAKARSWRDLDDTSIAIANADDPVVFAHVGEGGGQFETFGPEPRPSDGLRHWTVVDGVLVTPDGEPILAVSELPRSMPHDIMNSLAAAATAMAGGATIEGVRATLSAFEGLAHRVQLVAESDGIRWYDDSKATAPHAVIAASEAFDSLVLIAGGRNKGLDLSVLGRLEPRLRGVVGIGEAATDVLDAFDSVPSIRADSMVDAVAAAASMARPGDAVLLSPGCASFDWYRNYGERGDDFVDCVRDFVGGAS